MAAFRRIVCCVSVALLVVVESANVPVLMWSNHELKDIEPRWASSKEVQGAFNTKDVKSENYAIVVFLQNQLGFNDLAKYGGVYGEGSAVLSKMKDLSEKMPFRTVESDVYFETPAMESLAESGFEILRETPVSCGQLKKKAFFVDLPHEAITKQALEEADLAVSEAVSRLQSCGVPFTVVYTSSAPVMDVHPPHIGRSLFQSTSNDSNRTEELFFVVENKIKNTTCVMLYFTQLIYFELFDNATEVTVPMATWTANVTDETVTGIISGTCMDMNSTCGNENATSASVSFTNNRTRYDENGTAEFLDAIDTIQFEFPCHAKGYWNIDVSLTLNGTMNVLKLPLVQRNGINLSIPVDVSYHCTTELVWSDFYINKFNLSGSSITSYGVRIAGLQVQAYKDAPSGVNDTHRFEFTTAYDCQPYLSEAVWMGIVCMFPLFLMLYCSLAFIFQMETMDKFDDPRGKTISVASGR